MRSNDNLKLDGIVIEKNGKYYIEPGLIYVSPKGIFLNVQGNLVSIPKIEADEDGVYISVTGRCWVCGALTIGGLCINPDCPAKK